MMLVTPEELLRRIDDPDLRVADVRWYLNDPGRARAEYAAGHIPGAIFVDLDHDLSAPPGPGRHPLPEPAVFARGMSDLGIGSDHLVVAYDDTGGTTATRLWSEPGGPHHGSPDKEPAVRLRVLEDAGRSNVPFTTGILIGIGESYEERAESLFALRRTARAYQGIQEVIVQNFRAKPDTAMRGMPDAELEELAAAVAVTRVILGPPARIQAPPNLVDAEYGLLIGAGIDDWGGVSPLTPDHVNPERPWPHIGELAERTAASGCPWFQRR